MTEIEFQAQVVELAHLCGWRHLHIRRTRGKHGAWVTSTNLKGWPDLMLMRPPVGLIFAELKIPPNKTTVEQSELLAFLAGFPFARAEVWTPDDWPTIETTLSRKVAA